MFKAIYLTQEGKATRAELRAMDEAELPAGDVDVRVEWSTINYKDALAVTGKGAIVRKWPMVPGIDLAGVVEASRSPDWKPGDRVVVTGWGLGEIALGRPFAEGAAGVEVAAAKCCRPSPRARRWPWARPASRRRCACARSRSMA